MAFGLTRSFFKLSIGIGQMCRFTQSSEIVVTMINQRVPMELSPIRVRI